MNGFKRISYLFSLILFISLMLAFFFVKESDAQSQEGGELFWFPFDMQKVIKYGKDIIIKNERDFLSLTRLSPGAQEVLLKSFKRHFQPEEKRFHASYRATSQKALPVLYNSNCMGVLCAGSFLFERLNGIDNNIITAEFLYLTKRFLAGTFSNRQHSHDTSYSENNSKHC